VNIGIVVQARVSSVRLPGKVLMPLAGKAVLARLVERLKRIGSIGRGAHRKGEALPIVVATSRAPEDDAVEALTRSLGVGCYRGSLDDVAARLSEAARQAGFAAFVRVNADSPLLDPALIEHAYTLYLDGGYDVVSNVFPRSFPKGMSVELIAMEAMERVLESTDDAQDREHVTRFIYANSDRFRIRNFTAPRSRPDLQLSIDTREDFACIEACVKRLGARALEAGWEEIADCVEARA